MTLKVPRFCVLPELVVSVSHLMGFQFGYKDLDDAYKDEKVHLKR